MSLLILPKSTVIDKPFPKNAFDNHINPKQKKLFTEDVEKIRWANKLSKNTINLEGKTITEIHIFEIHLRSKKNIKELLEVMEKAIPYHTIFEVFFENQVMISTSQKHPSPSDENRAIIDWTFSSPWLNDTENPYQLNLTESLEVVFEDFCNQITGKSNSKKPINELIKHITTQSKLQKKIQQLENAISREKQYNKRVELNIELQKLKQESLLE